MHNVLNALSAIAVAVELNVPDEAVLQGAGRVQGRGPALPELWRCCRCGPANGGGKFTVIEDYGHHPVEIAATLAAARGAFPGRRLVLAFQPHRYTRTRDCFEDFVKVIGQADAVLLAEVYAAGEAPIVAADGRSLARAVRVAGKVEPVFVDDIAAMPAGHPGDGPRRRRGDLHGRRLDRRRAGQAGGTGRRAVNRAHDAAKRTGTVVSAGDRKPTSERSPS